MDTIDRAVLTFVLNALWQVPLIATAAALATRLMRHGPAGHRHAVWATALIAAVLLPAASLRPRPATIRFAPIPMPASLGMPGPADAASAIAATPASGVPATPSRPIRLTPALSSALVVGYLFFLAIGAARLAWAFLRTQAIRRAASRFEISPRLAALCMRAEDAFGMEGVDLLKSPSVPGPVTAGGAIILPERLLDENSADVLTTALGHEMAHLARRDFGWNLAYELLSLPISFHPVTALMRRRIESTREMACDEMVASRLLDPTVYARSILTIAASMTAVPSTGCALGVFDGGTLEERVRQLLEGRRAGLKRARLALAAGLSTVAICALAASGLSISALAQGAGAGERRLGAEAYNAGNYAAAVEHFKNALRADPDNITSRLHLANAYVRSFRGDAGETPADSPWLQRAREQYEQALQRDRKNKVAVGGLISLDMTTGRMAEAALLARHLAETDPKSWEAYQTLGYLDWVAAYKPIAEARGRATQAPDPSVRRRLRDQFLPILEDGQRVLQTALELEPDSADSMVFMNLTLRSKAALTDDPAEAKDLIASADQWTQKAIAGQAKWREKVKHDLEAAIDPESAPAAAAPVALPAPPPPPPPPPPGYAGEQTKAPPPPPPAEQKAEKDAPPPPPPPAQRKGSRKVPSPPPAAEPDAQKEPPPPPPPPPPKRKSSRKMPPPPPPPPPKQ